MEENVRQEVLMINQDRHNIDAVCRDPAAAK
jgi:hypothetical protein